MAKSPYRESARAELVVAGEPLVTVHVWAAWGVAVAFVVLAMVMESVSTIRAVLAGLVALVVTVLVLWRRAARRVRWRFVLERSTLQLERIARGKSELMGALDVRDGVRLDIEMIGGAAAGLDLSVALKARGGCVQWAPGLRAELAAAQLTEFLRERDVPVEAPIQDDVPLIQPSGRSPARKRSSRR